jgi:hypothetical protein
MKENEMETPKTMSGAALLPCEMDADCRKLDCGALSDELALALHGGADAAEYVAYCCGYRYLDGLKPDQPWMSLSDPASSSVQYISKVMVRNGCHGRVDQHKISGLPISYASR